MVERGLSLWRRLVARQFRPRGQDVGETPETDRRVWVRHPSSQQTVVQSAAFGEGDALPARVGDVSLGGIRLLVARRFEPGSLLIIEIPGGDQKAQQKVLAYVVHATQEENGEWRIGCTFARELTDADLRAFGARRLRATPPDPRSWVRFSCDLKASYTPVIHSQAERVPAQVLNVSPTGIGLFVDHEVETGTLLELRIFGPDGLRSLTMLACVVHVTAQDQRWALGCNFIRELNARDFEALL
jgi:hypothetical protein